MCAEFTLPLYDFATMPKCFNTARKLNEWKKNLWLYVALYLSRKNTQYYFLQEQTIIIITAFNSEFLIRSCSS